GETRAPGSRGGPAGRREAPWPCRASTARQPAALRSFRRFLHRIEERLRTINDGVVDHLAVDLDGGFPLGLRLPERGDDALGARQLLGGGQVRAVHRADLIGVHAQPALEAAAPAPLARPPQCFRLLELLAPA